MVGLNRPWWGYVTLENLCSLPLFFIGLKALQLLTLNTCQFSFPLKDSYMYCSVDSSRLLISFFRSNSSSPHARTHQNLFCTFSFFLIGRVCCSSFFLLNTFIQILYFITIQDIDTYSDSRTGLTYVRGGVEGHGLFLIGGLEHNFSCWE
jgi:hypothetical protein